MDRVHSLAANLLKMGVGQGDVVFLISPNVPDYAVIYLATISIGAVITTNNPAYTSGEWEKILPMLTSIIGFSSTSISHIRLG